MIPIKLTLQGLYSYQAKQTIDFTRLTSSGLFGIFGMVGSGKSSILEAITFALYGRTDRLNLSGDNRNYNMMNLKSKELLIDFIFEAGGERTLYRSTVKGRRNSKRFEEVKTLDRAAYRKVDSEWIPIEQEALQEAIGLSYENFKRTIIIPQGQFQEFLQLGNKDRTQMLKELFNLGKYEFYYKVAALETRNNEQKHILEGELKGLGDIDESQLDQYESWLDQLKEKIVELKSRHNELQLKEEQQRKLRELLQKSSEAEQELRKLENEEPVFRALEKSINRYEQCHYRFKHRLELLEEWSGKKEKREELMALDRKRLEEVEQTIEEIGKLLTEIRPAYEKREELQKRATELSLLLQMKGAEEIITKEKRRSETGKGFLDEATKQVERLKSEKQQLGELINKLRGKMPDLMLLSAIRSWHAEKRTLEKQLGDIDEETERYAREEKEIKQERALLRHNRLFEGISPDEDPEVLEDRLRQEVDTLKNRQRKIGEEEHHLLVKEQLKSYASELEEGHPCPLCGSRQHPEIFRSDDQEKQLLQLAEEKRALEEQLNQLASLSEQLLLLRSRERQASKQKEEWIGKGSLVKQQLEMHEGQFQWEMYHDEAALNNAFLEGKKLQDEIRIQEDSLTEKVTQLEQEEKNRERYRAALDQIRTTLTVQETTLATLREQLEIIDPSHYRESGSEEIERERQQLLEKHQHVVKQFEEKSGLLQEQTREKDALMGALVINNRELEQQQAAIDSLQEQLKEELAKSTFSNIGEVKEILSTAMDPESEKKKLESFRDSMMHYRSAFDQFQKEMEGRVYDARAHEMLIDEMNRISEEVTAKNQEHGSITGLLTKLKSDLHKMSELKETMEKLLARGENIRTMKSLFTASGFVNYISTVYLQNLCNAANDRFFRLTRQKLSLEITPDNSFQVRDFMHEGKVRSVKTLSGGQTFQASLSLALALADNIQQITRSSQNFFFLDEGFGSLDKESLGIVFDTLKTLRRENRIVGVISHVEEMQQEIEAHLRIENDPERGSLIRRSWEE
ncbi:MAG TPA: AAA family ATPase [Proteiniphilum sp.]|nr:AAA family ATPase [Proteiniphilum sp.]HPJ49175.1 AAA family ATPase [Proteiniphilum sp.]HPR19165.1 AAA family ATPase [Proteiniphilum sp.]